MNQLLELLEGIEDRERNLLVRPSKYSIHIARFFSIIIITILSFFLTFSFSILIGSLLDYFFGIHSNYKYLWSVTLLFNFPLIIPVFANWKDREFCFSSVIVDLIETVVFIKSNFGTTKAYFEIVGFVMYILINTIITIFAIANFVDETTLISFIESQRTSAFGMIAAVHTVIYITILVLLGPNKTLSQRYKKQTREFLLWLIVLLISTGYMLFKLLLNFTAVDMFYLIGALLVAVVRLVTSYKELRKTIVEVKETASFYL